MIQLQEVFDLKHVIQTLDKDVALLVSLQEEKFEHYFQLILL
jgi:hypothetical protein